MLRDPDGLDFQKGGMNGEFDPATQKLSNERVHELLYPAYMRRFARCVCVCLWVGGFVGGCAFVCACVYVYACVAHCVCVHTCMRWVCERKYVQMTCVFILVDLVCRCTIYNATTPTWILKTSKLPSALL